MPIYERTCTECEFTEDSFDKMSEADEILICPKCNKQTFKRDGISTTGFRLKGECWEKDGYTNEYTNSKANFGGRGNKQGLRKRKH